VIQPELAWFLYAWAIRNESVQVNLPNLCFRLWSRDNSIEKKSNKTTKSNSPKKIMLNDEIKKNKQKKYQPLLTFHT